MSKLLDTRGDELETTLTIYVYRDGDGFRFQQQGRSLSNAQIVWQLEQVKLALLTGNLDWAVEEDDEDGDSEAGSGRTVPVVAEGSSEEAGSQVVELAQARARKGTAEAVGRPDGDGA